MDRVLFTHLEHGDDIIISLSCDEDSTFGVDGLTIQRTPKYEFILSPHERGACVEWEADDIRVVLDHVIMSRTELHITTRGKVRKYHFDLRTISDQEYRDLVRHFRLINFDNSFKLEIRREPVPQSLHRRSSMRRRRA